MLLETMKQVNIQNMRSNNYIFICIFCLLLINSCKQDNTLKKDLNTWNLKMNDDTIKGKESILLNETFKYDVILVSSPSDSGFIENVDYEIVVDSIYINYINTLSIKEIIELLKSEESDFATNVILLKLYGNVVPSELTTKDSEINRVKKWRNGINKKNMVENWKKELIQRNHNLR